MSFIHSQKVRNTCCSLGIVLYHYAIRSVKKRFKEMFKKKKTESTLFESPSNLMRGRALKQYDDLKAWYNQFYKNVTNQHRRVQVQTFVQGGQHTQEEA